MLKIIVISLTLLFSGCINARYNVREKGEPYWSIDMSVGYVNYQNYRHNQLKERVEKLEQRIYELEVTERLRALK